MNRKETTMFLSRLLEFDKLSGVGKYWAKEVTLDYGKSEIVEGKMKSKTRRIDYLQFVPENQLSVSGIEKGIFICYEIKSCAADYLSGYGRNFIGEKNYFVMTMQTYRELKELEEIEKIPHDIGILVPMPYSRKYDDTKLNDEYNQPTEEYSDKEIENGRVYLETLRPARKKQREKSITELLFCMVRSGR